MYQRGGGHYPAGRQRPYLTVAVLSVLLLGTATVVFAQPCRDAVGGTYAVQYSGVSYGDTERALSALGTLTIRSDHTFDFVRVEMDDAGRRHWFKSLDSFWRWIELFDAAHDVYIPQISPDCQIIFGAFWDPPQFTGIVSDDGRFITLSISTLGGTAIRR